MRILGQGISTFDAKIKPDFIPQTTYALNWFKLANGDYACTDRSYTADKYDASIRLYGKETDMMHFITQIEANRVAATGANQITLTNFNSQEHIFGADLIYSGNIYATAFMERRGQKTWRGFEQPLKLSACLPLSFPMGDGSLPPFRRVEVGYDADADREIKKQDTYKRIFFYSDRSSDAGTFTGTFIFTDREMIKLRRFIATTRGESFSMPTISGVDHPFGRRVNPEYVRLIAFEDMGLWAIPAGAPMWRAKITLAEAF